MLKECLKNYLDKYFECYKNYMGTYPVVPYDEYEKSLKRSNAIDFDDLLLLPIKLFSEHKEVLEKYQEQYKYVFIDEYQDTNKPQYILSKLISSKYKNITVNTNIQNMAKNN